MPATVVELKTSDQTAVRRPIGLFYLVTVLGGLLSLVMINLVGHSGGPVVSAPFQEASTHVLHPLTHILVSLTAIIGLGIVLGRLLAFLEQPPVIGEILAGIALGPSLLGAIAPEAMHFLIPDAATDPHQLVMTSLQVIAQLGVILYMFAVGLELNPHHLGGQAHAALAISHASIIAPFVLGSGLALWLFKDYAPSGVSFTNFSLFLGIALSVTAFPVLARILSDRRLDKTEMGTLALSCAAADDVTAWCLLAVVVGVAQANLASAGWVAAQSFLLIAVMFLVIRPLAQRLIVWVETTERQRWAIPFVLLATLLSALATEMIGIHAIFGAFLLGVIIPHDSLLAQRLCRAVRDVAGVVFLPAFFAVTGMKTEIGLLSSPTDWLACGLIILVATLGKFGGTWVAARVAGLESRKATMLGLLMNTRGLMELIVLNIGLSMGILSPRLYAMMVLMALVTTMATAPLLRLLGTIPKQPA